MLRSHAYGQLASAPLFFAAGVSYIVNGNARAGLAILGLAVLVVSNGLAFLRIARAKEAENA